MVRFALLRRRSSARTPLASVSLTLWSVFLICFGTSASTCIGARRSVAADAIDFNRDIRPLLSDRCFACHGPDAARRQADLRLDDEASAKEFAIVPHDLEASEVFQRITTDDAEMVMPPPELNKPLTEDQISLIGRWIEEGASYAPYWAYADPRWHQPPGTDDPWPQGWIDRFVLAVIQDAGLTPAPDADPRALVRRLSLDLTGLPPDPRTVDRFAADPSEAAYRRLVDDYLGSPRFGERIATVWLDLVRYADTVGYHGDQDQNIAPYRDWVIDAFNADLPFDDFTRDQLAGDLVAEPTEDQRVASGYNRLLQTSHEGGVQPKEYRAIYEADRVRNVSAVWMGGTLGCAQCHDHKFDPYTARDFYSMGAFFADIDDERHFTEGTNTLPAKRPPEIAVNRPGDDERMTMITMAGPPRERRLLPRGNWLDDSGPVVEPAVPEFFGRPIQGDDRATRLDLAAWLTDVEHGTGGLTARVMANRYWHMLFGRGLSPSLADFGGQGQPPSLPELLDNLAVEFYRSGWDTKHLIRQIVLSHAYRQSSIVSAEKVEADPANRLFARQGRHRLSAEMVRDNALAVSGLLVLRSGGGSARPYQPAGYYRHLNFPTREYQSDTDAQQYRRGVYMHWQRQFLHPMLRAFDAPSREECTASRPRSNTPLAALVLLNDPTFVEAARGLALGALREPPTGDDLATDDRGRLEALFRRVVGRPADAFESETLLEQLQENRQYFAAEPTAAEQLLDVGLLDVEVLASDRGLDPAELAAWAEVSRTLLNLSEVIVRP